MGEFLKDLLFAAIPAVGNFGGGALAELFDASRRTLSFALHGAAGVVLAMVFLVVGFALFAVLTAYFE